MKRFSAGLVLMLLCTFSIFAQNKVITVSGRVVESDTKEPAAQATVQLLSLPDSAYAAGIASSNQGWFTLPKVKAGKYVLKVSYIGFRTKLVPVQLSANATDKKLGTITLDPDAVMLKEAVITAGFFVKFGGNLFFISTVFFFLNPIKSCRYVCFLVTLKTPHH